MEPSDRGRMTELKTETKLHVGVVVLLAVLVVLAAVGGVVAALVATKTIK